MFVAKRGKDNYEARAIITIICAITLYNIIIQQLKTRTCNAKLIRSVIPVVKNARAIRVSQQCAKQLPVSMQPTVRATLLKISL